MIVDIEIVMAALYTHLTGAVVIDFTADATANDATLANVSTFDGLFAGLPVFGPGVPWGALIASLDPTAGTVTLSTAVTESSTAAAMASGFLTTGRRVKHWSQVSDQPAMFLRRIGMTDQYRGQLQITTMDCEVWIYSNAGKDPDLAPDEVLTALEQAVRVSLEPHPASDGHFTLGNLVYWCRIEGHSDISPGDQSGQAISRIPIKITLP